MKTQIRGAVFETNSSSSHSVTVSGWESAHFGLSKEELRSGVIRIEQSHGFGFREDTFSDTKSKIAYLLINCAGGSIDPDSGDDLIPHLRENNPHARKLIEFVEEVTGCTLEFYANEYVYVDHQSQGVGMDLLDDHGQLHPFLFSKDSYIETGNDNSSSYDY